MIKIKKISICIVFLISFVIFNCIFSISIKADDIKSNNILVKPVLVNIRGLTDNLVTTRATVTDVNKPAVAAFRIMFGNYTDKEQTLSANVSIISKEDNKEVANFNENSKMQPYPNSGFCKTMKFNCDTKDVNMGNYILKYKAIKYDGEVIEGERPLAIGEMKGELKSVNIKDTYQGDTVKISAKVNNVDNLNLPVNFSVTIKNNKGEEVFKDEQQINISRKKEENIESQWGTTNVTVGEYTAEYSIKMGDEILSDTISFKVLGSYKLHIVIVSILIILFIMFVMIAKKKTDIKGED